ncbi:initiator tRNA phosphoribosyl transferase [Sistotremastrum niveocremeum HHB9708]|uniref:Initiator tRNA phosphoribosyl transferase n=1 Tax=Sistotremastrum niveocremeum HHB9708 TaxID=1314777 RepID=A0A164NJ66_9AGAM|nr:initiator tRNA phosphoribosyl transferase [Sistotremastrum niveocremeum HHB9708]
MTSVQEALKEIRLESFDFSNRIQSIDQDARFITEVGSSYKLPLFPNLRCGAWYTDPEISQKDAAYFKSTDGHIHNWSFNLRRPNLHLLLYILEYGGLLIVDSTTRGKRLPDALSKTVPIWCATINRAIQIRGCPLNWDSDLYTPPSVVSQSEHTQIETFIDGWARDLLASFYDLPRLLKPLRPIWITPETTRLPVIDSDGPFYPVICISASRVMEAGTNLREGGFTYVQGAGDDHETWSKGITPDLFWKHRSELVQTDRDGIDQLISRILSSKPSPSDSSHQPAEKIPVESILSNITPVKHVNSCLSIAKLSSFDVERFSDLILPDNTTAFILISPTPPPSLLTNPVTYPSTSNILLHHLPPGKKGQLSFLTSLLPTCLPFIGRNLHDKNKILIACESGKDASVGLALAALQLYFNNLGDPIEGDIGEVDVSKASLQMRLQWIVASRPEANPSRTTLKRVNEYLMSDRSFRSVHATSTQSGVS